MTNEAKQLIELVAKIIDQRRDAVRINPTWIATEALKILDPDRTSIPLVFLGCHLQLRQIARGICRSLFEPEDEQQDTVARDTLFPELQWRYPEPHRKDEEPSYVLREEMSASVVSFNVERLRTEGMAKLRHADALAAWHRNRSRAA
jgi:hypothetical protein